MKRGNSMNVLIIMPKIVARLDEWYMFPTGIAYVSSALKKANICNTYTCNLNCYEDTYEIVEEMMNHNEIDMVATGGLSIHYDSIYQVIKDCKKINQNVCVMVGGGFITSAPELAMELIPEIDFGMIGEGEITICELIEALSQGNDVRNIKGIIYRKEDEVIRTSQRIPIKDLDTIEYPDYDGFNFESTLKFSPVNVGIYKDRAAVLLTSRGCPYNCTFCFHPQGDGYRIRSLDSVFEELEWLIDKYRIKSVLILDELFGGNVDRLIEFCKRIKKYNLQWWVETRVQFASQENLRRMKESGCIQVLLGIENVNECILISMKKHITVDEIEWALQNAYEVGISAPGVLIFGDPVETAETAHKSMEWWQKHPEYNIMLTTLQVYPGSAVWEYAIKKGILDTKEKQMQHIKRGCPKLNLTNMSDDVFTSMCKQIGVLNHSRKVYIKDAAVFDEYWKQDKLIANVSGECSKCGYLNIWNQVNLLGEGAGVEPFICQRCGQSHTNSFQDAYLKNAVKNLQSIYKKYKSVVLWGQGRKLVAIYHDYADELPNQFFYIDNAPLKKGQNFYGMKIHSPEEILNYNASVIIIGVGDKNLLTIKNKVDFLLNRCETRPLIFTLNELMKKDFIV